LAAVVFESIDLDIAVGLGRYIDLVLHGGHTKKIRLRTARRHITAGDGLGIGDSAGRSLDSRLRIGKVAVQEVGPQCGTRTDFALPATVVGNKEPDSAFRQQMHVAVEVDGVATMPNDAVPVARLLIKAKTQPVQGRIEAQLPGVHQSRSLRTKNLRTI